MFIVSIVSFDSTIVSLRSPSLLFVSLRHPSLLFVSLHLSSLLFVSLHFSSHLSFLFFSFSLFLFLYFSPPCFLFLHVFPSYFSYLFIPMALFQSLFHFFCYYFVPYSLITLFISCSPFYCCSHFYQYIPKIFIYFSELINWFIVCLELRFYYINKIKTAGKNILITIYDLHCYTDLLWNHKLSKVFDRNFT